MTCEALLRYLSDYIDKELVEELTKAAQHHLSTYHQCQVVLNTTQQVILLGRGLGQRTTPSAQRARLFIRLQAAFLINNPHA